MSLWNLFNLLWKEFHICGNLKLGLDFTELFEVIEKNILVEDLKLLNSKICFQFMAKIYNTKSKNQRHYIISIDPNYYNKKFLLRLPDL